MIFAPSRPHRFIRCPIDEIDEDKILFYDVETDHQYAPYAKLKMAAVQYGISGRPELVETEREQKEFQRKLVAADVIKVDFNGVNFDRVVCHRHGYSVHPQNAHDIFLMLKTIKPNLPGFGMKFAAFLLLGDPHFPEMRLHQWMSENNKEMYEAPHEILAEYNLHDITQTVNLFRACWDIIIRPEHWPAYLLDLAIGEPLLEMELEGGLFLDRFAIWTRLQRLQKRVKRAEARARILTGGKVQNPNSSRQLGKYFTEVDKLELELTDSGEFCVKKSVLVSLRETNPLARIAYKIREAHGTDKYYNNYLEALDDKTYEGIRPNNWIPIQVSASAARTRRFTSQSFYKLNFQNPNKDAKAVELVPDGFLGIWFDATQIENVVHIFESEDYERRRAYEDDESWNEYVWLCNQILGTNKTKKELDDDVLSRSPQIPNWTIYKQYKTGKLALNFGMGTKKFCKLFGLSKEVGEETFRTIHRACPSIRLLQNRVACDLRRNGFVTDVFSHRYAGPVNLAYKVVAYLIQGCGTGSLPKAQIRANWESLRSFDRYMPKSVAKCGVSTGTTHDENSVRLDLRLGPERILQLLQKMNHNMTGKFSHLFDDIPLRSKMYLSRTTNAKRTEVLITDHEKILKLCEN